MKSFLLYTFIILMSVPSVAQKSKDLEAIKSLCGCFEVEFKYAETFSPDENYEFHDRYYAKAVEYAFPIEEDENRIVIQHVLAINDNVIIKHWREDWEYEEGNLYTYQKNNIWFPQSHSADQTKGAWSQKVYGVNDEPRYEGVAEWSHVNGKSMWESKVDSPLPRREYTKRSDYNVMSRGNRIHVYDDNFMHEQDNDKVLRENGDDKLIASEKGFNHYVKIDDSKCAAVTSWWEEDEVFWKDVRAAWSQRFAKKTPLELQKFVRTKMLTEYMSELSEDYESTPESKAKVAKIINMYSPVPSDIMNSK